MRRAHEWADSHPRLVAWGVLATVMGAVVAYDARRLGLRMSRVGILVLAAVAFAALAVWLVNGE